MRYFLLLTVLLAAMLGAEEVLVWQDEFNVGSLNKQYWTPEVGFVRNERAAQIYRADRVAVRGGSLQLTATYSSRGYPNPYLNKGNAGAWQSTRPSADYASGAVNSLGKFSMRYGRVEIRAKFNVASGAWPALWMLGSLQAPPPSEDVLTFWNMVRNCPWPACGEIDILEYATRDDAPAQAARDRRTVWSTFHWGDSWQGAAYKHFGKTRLFDDLDQSNFAKAPWHRYGMTWTPDRITLTCDDLEVITMATADMRNPASGKSPFRENYFHFILNLALGSMANPPPPNGKGYPITFAIDYVRVWQDPTVIGSGILLKGKEDKFAHLTSNCPTARLFVPTDAREGKSGDLALGRSPAVLGGFAPTHALTLSSEVTLPARASAPILTLCADEKTYLEVIRGKGNTAAIRLIRAGKRAALSASFPLEPGRHTLRLTTSATDGTTLTLGETELLRDATLHLAANEPIRFITFAARPSSAPSPNKPAAASRTLLLHALNLQLP